MKWYRTRDGRPALWLTEEENESLVEDELLKAKLFPTADNPVVDVERFLERHLKVQLDQHAVLPETLLGMTEFIPGKPPRVSINRDLTGAMEDDGEGAAGQLGRWRATLAHEAIHVALHRCIFEPDKNQQDLFGVSSKAGPRLFRCLKGNVLFRGGGREWQEIQANRGMAALLMPAPVFKKVAAGAARELGYELETLPVDRREPVVHLAAGRFQVSRHAARIRFETLRLWMDAGQLKLKTG